MVEVLGDLQEQQALRHKHLTLEASEMGLVVMDLDFQALDHRDLQRQQAHRLRASIVDMVMVDLVDHRQLLNQVPTLTTLVV